MPRCRRHHHLFLFPRICYPDLATKIARPPTAPCCFVGPPCRKSDQRPTNSSYRDTNATLTECPYRHRLPLPQPPRLCNTPTFRAERTVTITTRKHRHTQNTRTRPTHTHTQTYTHTHTQTRKEIKTSARERESKQVPIHLLDHSINQSID